MAGKGIYEKSEIIDGQQWAKNLYLTGFRIIL